MAAFTTMLARHLAKNSHCSNFLHRVGAFSENCTLHSKLAKDGLHVWLKVTAKERKETLQQLPSARQEEFKLYTGQQPQPNNGGKQKKKSDETRPKKKKTSNSSNTSSKSLRKGDKSKL